MTCRAPVDRFAAVFSGKFANLDRPLAIQGQGCYFALRRGDLATHGT
jgi:hypothetical protein